MTLPGAFPVVGAPMAGGPTTPELVAAVSSAGGFGFVAAGYLTTDVLRKTIERTRQLTDAAFGVNVFVPTAPAPDDDAIAAYAESLADAAAAAGVELGSPRWDDDEYTAKLELLAAAPVHTVSFTFGCPSTAVIGALHRVGSRVAVTVTGADDARTAADAGADLLVVQGHEAGGHQSTTDAAVANNTSLLDALAAVHAVTALPTVAAGGIMTRADATRALDRGAEAVQLGTALLCADEAGTSRVHRHALLGRTFADTIVTRAFSGRWARGLANRFAREHPDAPSGYPQLHQLTRPLRAAATKAGDPELPNLWAGTGWQKVTAARAADIVRAIAP
ncbi:MAG: nitronate monooxygenase [Jatrophihabitans sp.]